MEENVYCRLCLSTSVVYYSLLRNNGKQMLFSLTGIRVSAESRYSTESCAKCWLDLKLAYRIQQKFTQADKKFQLTGIQAVTSKIDSKAKIGIAGTSIRSSYRSDLRPDVDPMDIDLNTSLQESECGSGLDLDERILIEVDDPLNVAESCVICGVKCENALALYSHTNSHYHVVQECGYCDRKLSNIALYRDHLVKYHAEKKNDTHQCGICKLTFKYFPLYKKHINALHSQTLKVARTKKEYKEPSSDSDDTKFSCTECKKEFRSSKKFNAHVKGHLKKDCPICGASITITNLNKHIQNHDSGPVQCHLCGVTAKNPASLRGHMFYTHSEKQIKCEHCDKVFKKLYVYKLHVKKEHTGEKSFVCDTCGKSFFTNFQLNCHIRIRHLKERKHICKFCKKGFSSRFSMRTHERQHTNEAPYMCELCGLGFRQNVSLRHHKKTKHHVYEVNTEECQICGKMFKDDWALKSHERSVHS